jgi:hypothetical protein
MSDTQAPSKEKTYLSLEHGWICFRDEEEHLRYSLKLEQLQERGAQIELPQKLLPPWDSHSHEPKVIRGCIHGSDPITECQVCYPVEPALEQSSPWAREQYQKIQDFVIRRGLYRGQNDNKSHADIVLELAELGLPRAAPPPGREWQPIETAPKGIKVIAGYPNRLGKWRSVMACYYLPGTLACDDDSADDDGYAPAGWYEESETHDHIMRTDEPPTHWMPLTASPLTKCEGRSDG